MCQRRFASPESAQRAYLQIRHGVGAISYSVFQLTIVSTIASYLPCICVRVQTLKTLAFIITDVIRHMTKKH